MESPASASGPCVYLPVIVQVLGISPAPDPSLHPQFATATAPARHLPNPSSPARKASASSTDSTSTSTSSEDRDRALTSIRPTPMKKTAPAPAGLSPTAARRNGRLYAIRPSISITHTNDDDIVYAEPASFRNIVHALTGAASGDKGLLPITSPARAMPANRPVVTASTCTAAENAGGGGGGNNKGGAAGVGKPAGDLAMNLLERRKSNKVLEKLTTSCRNLPPLMPSPVTPLAGLPVTPSSSEGSLTPGRRSIANMSPLSHGAKAMESLRLCGDAAPQAPKGGSALPRPRSVNDSSADASPCATDAMEVEPCPLQRPQSSLSLRTGEDMPPAATGFLQRKAVWRRSQRARNADGLSLALAPGSGALCLPRAADEGIVREDVVEMETQLGGVERPAVGAGEVSIADREEVFFIQVERSAHADPTLLPLFPESTSQEAGA